MAQAPSGDRVLKLIDESMGILDYIEREIGELAKSIANNEPPSKGTLYSLYSLVVRLRDKMIEIRNEAYSSSTCSHDENR